MGIELRENSTMDTETERYGKNMGGFDAVDSGDGK
jgi:hypothetical protein